MFIFSYCPGTSCGGDAVVVDTTAGKTAPDFLCVQIATDGHAAVVVPVRAGALRAEELSAFRERSKGVCVTHWEVQMFV